jgi:glycine/D-amino acid oxidase-like deaminating enzyme
MRSMELWRALARDLAELDVAWSGGLLWDMPPAELEAYAREHSAWGYPARLVDRKAISALEPGLKNPPELAVHVAAEGVVEPVHAAKTLAGAAAALGVRTITGRPATALRVDGRRIAGLETAAGLMEADEIVVAAGVATPALLASAGIGLPIDAPPGLLVVSKPAPKLLNGLAMAPELHMRQRADGCLVAGADFGGTDPGADPEGEAAATFAALRGLLRSGETLEFSHFTVGARPTPADGFPAVGRIRGVEGLYVAVTHSGVTLATAIGRFVTEELLEGRRDPLLAPYSPDRFASG